MHSQLLILLSEQLCNCKQLDLILQLMEIANQKSLFWYFGIILFIVLEPISLIYIAEGGRRGLIQGKRNIVTFPTPQEY